MSKIISINHMESTDINKIKEELINKLAIIDLIMKADIDYNSNNDENILINTWDRINILIDMKQDLSKFNWYSTHLESLFFHVDNIRFAYAEEKMQVPTWFRKKYSHKFLESAIKNM